MKKVSLLLILVFAAVTAFAQESGVSAEAGRKTTFVKNGFWDNWFIGAGAGATMYFGGGDQHAGLFNRFTVTPNVQFGKWVNPYWGGRVKVSGGRIHTFENQANDMYGFNHVLAEANLMFNATNYLLKYNENRVYSFIPYAGVGFAYAWDHELNTGRKRSAAITGGIINNFRLSKRISLAIEFSGVMVKDGWDGRTGGKWSYGGYATGSASLICKLGKTDFQEAVLMDQGLIDGLNDQINRLRQENAKLALRPEKCDKCPEVTTKTVEVVKNVGVNGIVIFRIGSANVDKNQETSIFNTAKYLQDNPNAKVKVVGYADKKTGTPSINDRLSEKRAKNVANALINKYNISSNRVTVEWKGDTVQPYAENAWNRVAIMISE